MVHRPVSWVRAAVGSLGPDELPGGLRSYSDERLPVGRLLEVEVLLPDGGTASALVQVAWSHPLSKDHPARFDVGLRFVRAVPEDLARIETVLAPG
jgi:hypothetical protein